MNKENLEKIYERLKKSESEFSTLSTAINTSEWICTMAESILYGNTNDLSDSVKEEVKNSLNYIRPLLEQYPILKKYAEAAEEMIKEE